MPRLAVGQPDWSVGPNSGVGRVIVMRLHPENSSVASYTIITDGEGGMPSGLLEADD